MNCHPCVRNGPYPTKAAKLQLIEDLPSQRAMLLSLSNVVYRSPATGEVELWRVRKDSPELRCGRILDCL